MKIFEKHTKAHANLEQGIVLLARSFHRMKSHLHKILSMLKSSRNIETKIEHILKDLAKSGLQLNGREHLLRDFYSMLSKAKTCQGEARNILLHYQIKENHDVIEQAYKKFDESHTYTKEASRILKKMTKKNLLR